MTTRHTAPAQDHQLVPLQDAAAHLHVSVKTIRRRIADGTLAGYRVGRAVRVYLDELDRALLVSIPTARDK